MKKRVYSESAYYYAQKVADEEVEWNEKSIVRYQKEMAKAALSIWKQ